MQLQLNCTPHFKVWTDHRPLVGAFNKHLHLMQNKRLKRMREKLKNYNFSVIWTPGKTHHISDAPSLAPVFGPCELHFEPEHLERSLRIFADEDARYTETIDFLKTGKHISSLNSSSGVYHYRNVLHQLCIKTYRGEQALVLDGCRLVVPKHKCSAIYVLLHSGYSGVAQTHATILLAKHEERYRDIHKLLQALTGTKK